MATLTNGEQNHIIGVGAFARTVSAEYMALVNGNTEFYGDNDYDATITDEKIDNNPAIADTGLTAQDVAEVNFIRTTLLQTLTPFRLEVLSRAMKVPNYITSNIPE